MTVKPLADKVLLSALEAEETTASVFSSPLRHRKSLNL